MKDVCLCVCVFVRASVCKVMHGVCLEHHLANNNHNSWRTFDALKQNKNKNIMNASMESSNTKSH